MSGLAFTLGIVAQDLLVFAIVYGVCYLQTHGLPPDVDDDDTIHLW